MLFTHLAGADSNFQPQQFSDIENALGGTIPFPPQRFLEGLVALDQKSSINSAIFPHGRSLERSVTDYYNPRTVMAFQTGLPQSPYFLYLGYTPNIEELEVIAWNWKQKQFDFKLVQSYGPGKTPRVVNAYRPQCMSCHQGGGPIFPKIPWNETLSGDRSLAEDLLSPYILSLSLDPSVRIRLETPALDFQSDAGNRLLQAQNICENACGGDLECRKGILLSALLENIEYNSSKLSTPWRQKMLQAMEKVWPKDGFGILNPAIADRVVNSKTPLQFESSEDPLRLRKIVNGLDPGEVTEWYFLPDYSKCWNFNSDQRQVFKDLGLSQVDSAMDTEQLSSLVKTWLPSENEIFRAILNAVNSPQKIISSPTVPWSPPMEAPGIVSDPSRPKQKTTALFANYCMSCHSGPTSQPPILPLSNLHSLKLYVGSANRTVRDLLSLEHPLMPPKGAPQPTLEERRQMISDLN